MSKIVDEHLDLVRAANESTQEHEHQIAVAFLNGFRACAQRSLGAAYGRLLMSADEYYIGIGVDRPMCGGLFLDWKENSK